MMFDKIPDLPPVDNDQFTNWLDDPITQHLLKDLQFMYMDTIVDPLPTTSIDKIAINSIRRDTCREFVSLVLEWTPSGVTEKEHS